MTRAAGAPEGPGSGQMTGVRGSDVVPSECGLDPAAETIRTLMASLAVVGSTVTRCPSARQLPRLPSPFLTA